VTLFSPAVAHQHRMGKTNPTYRDSMQHKRQEYADAERAVRRPFQDAWDQLWVHASDHADVMHIHNPRDPMEGILMSICLGQQLEIEALQERVDTLEDDGTPA